MRDSLLLLSDAQSRTNPTSAGTISDNVHDLEKDSVAAAILTDDQIEGFLNVIITSATLSSGGTEGITLQARTDDATNLATAKDGVSAGYEVIGSMEVSLEKVVTGAKFSIPIRKDIMKRYAGGWLKATSTTYTGVIIVDMEFSDCPISENEPLQKVTS